MASNGFLRATASAAVNCGSLRGLLQVSRIAGRNAGAITAHRCYSSTDDKNVAFIGLGNMGVHMAGNLVKKGYKVRGYDLSEDAMNLAIESGVQGGVDVPDTMSSAAFVISCLPNNDIVRHVYLSDNGIIAKAPKGALLADSSTVDPAVSRELYNVAKKKGLEFIDAPVSGGVIGAENATLAFLCGGDESAVSRARAYLLCMGARVVHCGTIGAGELAKLVNNQLMGVNMLAAAECYNLAISQGLDPKIFHEVVNNSTGRSWATEIYNPVPGLTPNAPASKNYDGGFKIELLVKDLYLASKLILESRTPVPLSSISQQFYRLMQIDGFGNKDFSFIYKYLQAQVRNNEGGSKQ